VTMLLTDRRFGNGLPDTPLLTYAMGDFWYRFFDDQAGLTAMVQAVRDELVELDRSAHASIEANLLFGGDLLDREDRFPYLLDPSLVELMPIRFGDQLFFGNEVYYGQSIPMSWRFPLPANLYGITGVADRGRRPSRMLIEGQGCFQHRTPRDNWLQMHEDPRTVFRTIDVPKVGHRLLVWLHGVEIDRLLFARRRGMLVGLVAETTPPYMQAVEAALSADLRGGDELNLRRLLAAIAGGGMTEQDEVVEVIHTDRPMPVVITDRATYVGPATSLPVVVAGARAPAGTFLFDNVKFARLNQAPTWLSQFHLMPDITGLSQSQLITRVPASLQVVQTDEGLVANIANASDEFNAWINRPVGQFATWISKRNDLTPDSNGQFAISDFPSKINVLETLVGSPVTAGVSLSLIKASALVDNAHLLARLIRRVIPPHHAHIIEFDGDPPPGWIGPNGCSPNGLQLFSRPERPI
jgi:hypothetical protein